MGSINTLIKAGASIGLGVSQHDSEVNNIQAQYGANSALLGLHHGAAVDANSTQQRALQQRTTGLIQQQRTGFAAGNVDINSGTAAQLQRNTQAQGNMDLMTLRANAAREAWGYQVQQGALATNEGTQLTNANNAELGVFFNAFGSLAGAIAGGGEGGIGGGG
jgi:hypothetical protein